MHKAMAIVAALLIVSAGVLLARGMAHADVTDYDANGNGRLEKDEVFAVVIDYFRDEVTKDEVLEVLVFYFLSDASPEPTPTPTSTPEPPVAEEDVTAPELVEVTLDRSEIDVSSGAGIVDVTVTATDDISGIKSVELYFESPTEAQSAQRSARDPIMGTANEGTYALRLTLPRYGETGTWRLKYVWVRDEVGNHREYRAAELAALGLSASFDVVSTEKDTTAPEIVEVVLGSSEVGVSDGAGTIDVTVKATDDISGIKSVELYFESPTGAQSAQKSARDPLKGTSNDAEYAFRLTLPQYSESGIWRLKYVWIRDKVGNNREYRAAELAALGLSASFEVVAAQEDLTPPELVAVILESSEVDVGTGTGTIDVKVKATDDLAGIASVELYFESPTEMQSAQKSARDPIMGTANEGTYAFRLTIPQYSEAGTWRLKYVWVRDEVGNHREYRAAELAALGLSASFEVVD